jgi:hypothetical protein
MTLRALFICGSLNQTTMMHKIALCLPEFNCFFTPFYAEGILRAVFKTGLLDHSILGGKHLQATQEYLEREKLMVDKGGRQEEYDLVVTCTDLIVQSNIRNKRLLLVQEGITIPEDYTLWLVKNLKLPRYLANTAATGLSDAYDRFCVASNGYRDLFIHNGVKPEKIVVTGIPNFDNAQKALKNDLPIRHYVLVATSSLRETGKFDDRIGFLKKVIKIAAGGKIIFKLHPNENIQRAENEILSLLPDSIILKEGNTNHLVANCDVLITQISSVVFTGIALNKKVYSDIDPELLYQLAPIQNNGTSAEEIAKVCRQLVEHPLVELRRTAPG